MVDKKLRSKKAVVGIVFNADQTRVLLIKRRDVPIWVLPGGGADDGETPEEAVVREILEETGLIVRILRKVAEYSPLNRLTLPTDTFICDFLDGRLTTGNETRDLDFFLIKELPDPFFIVHASWLKDALQNTPHVIRRPIHEVTYPSLLKYFIRHPLQVMRFVLSLLGFPMNSKIDR